MSSVLPAVQTAVFTVLFATAAACMSLSAAAHVYISKPRGPPLHVMKFQCATLAWTVLQQAYIMTYWSTRVRNRSSGLLSAKSDLGFLLFFVVFGMPLTFATTAKIVEFRPVWSAGAIPLQWRLVIADTVFAWFNLVILAVWGIVEASLLRRRFGHLMWRVSLATLNEERARADAELMDKRSMSSSRESFGESAP